MKSLAAPALLTLLLAGRVHARTNPSHPSGRSTAASAHATAPPPHVFLRPAPPLPMLPTIARVRVETARDRLVVLEEVTLPRGEWQSGGLDLFVSFGSPGTPIAVDAHLAAVPAGSTEARADDAGEALVVDPAVRHFPSTQLLLGRPSMAGFVVRVKDAQLRRAYALGEAATLRIRSLLAPPSADPTGARDVVVRLGVVAGQPLALEKVQLVALDPKAPVTRAEATLCGPDADPWPLSVGVLPRATDAPAVRTIAPAMAVRRPTDDLCVRWWLAP